MPAILKGHVHFNLDDDALLRLGELTTNNTRDPLPLDHYVPMVRSGMVYLASLYRTKGNRGWYTAISEAAPKYLGVEVPPSLWPKGPRTPEGTLTEVEMTHWPESLRALLKMEDPRLTKVRIAA